MHTILSALAIYGTYRFYRWVITPQRRAYEYRSPDKSRRRIVV